MDKEIKYRFLLIILTLRQNYPGQSQHIDQEHGSNIWDENGKILEPSDDITFIY